jgi:hypothetical protein
MILHKKLLTPVKTGLNELYTADIAIERANEGYDGWNNFSLHMKNACPLFALNYPVPAHHVHGYFIFVSNRDKGLVQAFKENFPTSHLAQCCIHIQRNNRFGEHIYDISRTFSLYPENKLLEKIKNISQPAYDYLVGEKCIAADKWRSTEWLRNKTLPPRYGIGSTNSSKSTNSIYEEARQLQWLYCLDTILNTMCTRISTREANRNETGVVHKCAQTMEMRWKECAGMTTIQLEPGGDGYKVTRLKKHFSNKIQKEILFMWAVARVWYSMCGCHGLLLSHQKQTLQEILASDAVSDFHKYPFYHYLMKRNINPVAMGTLITSKEESSLQPDVVVKQRGRAKTK